MAVVVNADSVIRKLKFDHIRAKNEHEFRSLELLTSLLLHLRSRPLVIQNMIQETANLIQKHFKFRYTMIGLRNLTDGLYYYEVNSGMRQEAWTNQKSRKYKKEDFELSTSSYSAAEISKLSRVYLEEVNPLGATDVSVLNRPVLHGGRRKTDDDALEADFIDTLILGPGDDLLGWIEYSGTVTGKFPDAVTIKNIEVIAGILSVALVSLGYAQ